MAQIHELFDRMLENEASDLHLAEGKPPRFRLHGRMVAVDGWESLDRERIRLMMREICDEHRWAMFEETGDLDFAYPYEDKARFRSNYNRQFAGYGAVFRIIPSHIKSLDELKMPEVLKRFGDFGSGMVLVTGPTGSGKTTTLAAIIDHLNSNMPLHMLTIEEPVEFVHPFKKSTIVQREVHRDCLNFSDGLESASRQDFDVIMVGEMRDLETIGLALTAAEMGTLVFGTLHTNSAIKTIDRVVDVFPAEQQQAVRSALAVSLKAVCAQMLMRTADGRGRIAAIEILLQNRAVSNYIREGKTNQIEQVMMSGRAAGMQMMDDVIEGFLKEGRVSAEQAYMKALDKERFAGYLEEDSLPV